MHLYYEVDFYLLIHLAVYFWQRGTGACASGLVSRDVFLAELLSGALRLGRDLAFRNTSMQTHPDSTLGTRRMFHFLWGIYFVDEMGCGSSSDQV